MIHSEQSVSPPPQNPLLMDTSRPEAAGLAPMMDPRVDRASTPMTAPIPTTPHRTVRFQLDDTADDYGRLSTEDQGWADREDFMFSEDEDYDERRRSHDEDDDAEGPSSAPLLTRLEAPAVTVAMDQAAADLIEGRERPLSGMGMAFFNMSWSFRALEVEPGRGWALK